MKLLTALIAYLFLSSQVSLGQCPTCGNGVIDPGETYLNCPSDVPHDATCSSPCSQPTSYETTVGIRDAYDFSGTTTFGAAALPSGWSFAGAPTSTTSGTLPAADAYGAKAGLVQPNCSGSCTSTNGFCIGNLANNITVGAGGTGGKLGANFDGRPNISQNLSYAVLRGQNSPTLVSPTYNFSSVEGFKVQFWLFPSETSCGQSNSWGSCVGNVAYLDFSSNGGTSWTQVLQMDLNSTNSDMCTSNSTNTKWLNEGSWSRVCVTVFKTSTATGNFYPAATGTTAASGIMVNNAFFTSSFKFRIRYSQTASCTSGISTTNPGRYLAIDYPVITSGNQMIPCGISFANMCGYGADNNDDGVGSSSATTMTTVFGTVKRCVNQAERGVEILTSQNSVFASQNLTGSTFATNYDLCNAEGGDQQCIDWTTNNNFYTAVYECITDWEAASGSINLQYYKGTSAQSTSMTKVTTAGKTAAIGWRYSGNRIVSCGTTSDLNPGCNGYSFLSSSLPTQFSRGFYALAVNNLGQAWSYYGASSCSNYFSGPSFAPVSIPTAPVIAPTFTNCVNGELFLTADASYCSSSNFVGTPTISASGPSAYSETFTTGGTGTIAISTPGDYSLTVNLPNNPVQCLDCSRSICVTITQTDLDNCATALPVRLVNFYGTNNKGQISLKWESDASNIGETFQLEASIDGITYEIIGVVNALSNQNLYSFTDSRTHFAPVYYRITLVNLNGSHELTRTTLVKPVDDIIRIFPNPAQTSLTIQGFSNEIYFSIYNMEGKLLRTDLLKSDNPKIDVRSLQTGMYFIQLQTGDRIESERFIKD